MISLPFYGHGILLLISHLRSEYQMVHSVLSTYGYHIHNATIGIEGLRLLFNLHPDLILLDDSLPDLSSETLWRRIRNFTPIPIIFLGQQPPIISTYALGNDDSTTCLSRPLQPALLVAQVKQALQPAAPQTATLRDSNVAAPAFELIVDHHHCQVILGSKLSTLNAAEYQLLRYLLKNTNQLLFHEQMLSELWGVDSGKTINQLHTLIWRLRRKIEQNPRRPKHLFNHYGVGYSFEHQGIVEHKA